MTTAAETVNPRKLPRRKNVNEASDADQNAPVKIPCAAADIFANES